jgi:hypothetical protein
MVDTLGGGAWLKEVGLFLLLLFFFLLLLHSTGDLLLAQQAVYYLSHAPGPLLQLFF